MAQQESGGSNVQAGDTDGQDNPSQEGAIILTFSRADPTVTCFLGDRYL